MFYNLARVIMKSVSIFFAIVFLVFGGLAVNECIKYKDYVSFEATVTDAYEKTSYSDDETTTNHYVDISYTYDGEEYTATQQVLSASYAVGDKIEIRCNPDDPSELAGNIVLFVFVILAVVFGFISLVLGIVSAVIKKIPMQKPGLF